MIGRLTGTLLEKNPPQILLDVQGVGYEVDVPMSTFYNLPGTGERVALFTHLVVREDAHLLYGFGSEPERRAFRQLLRISGIGARTSCRLGSTSGSLASSDADGGSRSGTITAAMPAAIAPRIPGIGKKTAERLLLELKDKLGADLATAVGVNRPPPAASDILNALLALGYSEREAVAAVKALPDGLAVGDGIRQALKALAKA